LEVIQNRETPNASRDSRPRFLAGRKDRVDD